MDTNTPTPTPITTPTSGNGKMIITIGVLVLVLGGAFFAFGGGSSLKGAFINTPTCVKPAQTDIDSAKLLPLDPSRKKYLLNVILSDGTKLDPRGVKWDSKDLPQGVKLVSADTDNSMEVAGAIPCPFVFNVTVTDKVSGESAQKAYYINPATITANTKVMELATTPTMVSAKDTRTEDGTRTTTLVPPASTTKATPPTTSIAPLTSVPAKATSTGIVSSPTTTDGRTTASTTSATDGRGTADTRSTAPGAAASTISDKFAVGTKVLGKLGNTDGWIEATITSASSLNTYKLSGFTFSLEKSEIALYSYHPGKLAVGDKIIVIYTYVDNAGKNTVAYTSAIVKSVSGDKITAFFNKKGKGDGVNGTTAVFDRMTQVWMDAQSAGL